MFKQHFRHPFSIFSSFACGIPMQYIRIYISESKVYFRTRTHKHLNLLSNNNNNKIKTKKKSLFHKYKARVGKKIENRNIYCGCETKFNSFSSHMQLLWRESLFLWFLFACFFFFETGRNISGGIINF